MSTTRLRPFRRSSRMKTAVEFQQPGIQFELLRAFALTREQEGRLAARFYDAKAAAYRDELVTLANRFGLERQRAMLSPQIRDALRAEARMHAQSVVRTYNRLMVNEVNRLSTRNLTPDQMVQSLAEHMRSRGAIRSPMIAKVEAATARLDARAAFYRENGIEPEFDFVGPAPQCPICEALLGTNPHSLEKSLSVGYPHINCTHHWESRPVTAEQLRAGGIRPGQISVGRGEPGGIVGSPTWLERGGAGSQNQARDNLALLG